LTLQCGSHRWRRLNDDITSTNVMEVVRTCHREDAEISGNYHAAVTDGTGVPFLTAVNSPPYPRLMDQWHSTAFNSNGVAKHNKQAEAASTAGPSRAADEAGPSRTDNERQGEPPAGGTAAQASRQDRGRGKGKGKGKGKGSGNRHKQGGRGKQKGGEGRKKARLV
jgi:hypothetical protein